MLRDRDPRMDDATRRRLAGLIDAIETGSAPTPAEIEQDLGPQLQIVGDNRGPDEPRRPGRRLGRTPLIVAVAAALALVVGIVAVLRASSDEPDHVSNDPGDIPRLVPDAATLPDAFQQISGADMPLPPDQVDPGSATVILYGDDAAADDPLSGTDLAVIVVRDETIGMGGSPVQVRGHEGRAGTGAAANDVGIALVAPINWITWDETDPVEVTLASRRLTGEQLAAIAEDLTVDDGGEVHLGDLPAGIAADPIGTVRDAAFSGVQSADGTAPGHMVFAGGSNGGFLVVATYLGDDGQFAVARWMTGADQPIGIRGRAGWAGRSVDGSGQPFLFLLWPEADGVIGIAETTGLTDEQTLDLVDGLHAADEAEWQEIVQGE
jgi:hypothetical protein